MKNTEKIYGYKRPDGRFGTRNHVLVIATVSCVNGVINRVAKEVPEAVCIPHGYGCGRGGRDREILFRVFSGMIRHPNVGGAVLVGLGCERSNIKSLLPLIDTSEKPVTCLNVQEEGGSLKTGDKAIKAARKHLSAISGAKREPMDWKDMLVAIECGGSDAFSGITANVAMGAVSDWLIDRGASVMFGENTEMIGTGHVLARRAQDEDVAKQITQMVDRAEDLTRKILGDKAGLVISPGNMDGGMSSIAEKSMGCIVKGGTRPIVEVVDYGQPPSKSGLILQDGPGYDPDSLTGFAASGSQLMFFTTGRGSPAGFPGIPVIKAASNSRTYRAMEDDMDINAGELVEGKQLDKLRDEIIEKMIRTINGELSKPEANRMDVFTMLTVNPSF
ncbi:MAG: UxaA family hydrolase [Desulfobacterales bacterium]